MTEEQKRLLSGMFKNYMPSDIDYADIQKFDANGKAIPFSDIKLAGEAVAKSMPERMSDEDVHEAADLAEQIKAELKRMLKSMNKPKDEGMLSTAKEKKIAEGYHQMPDGSKMKDSEMEEEVSTDVAKDLDDEGRGLKGYKPPVDKMKEGWKQIEGSNAISVDEKSEHWQTKKGYDEAIKMYGTKPAWVKEPSLEYNPKTKKYDPIEKEEFVDLKPKKDLSAFA
jgi:hypothetical protein